jgi:hypothetical protein
VARATWWPRVWCALLGCVLLAACGEPTGSERAAPTEAEKYDAWIEKWATQANQWSRAFFAATKTITDSHGRLSIDAVHRIGHDLTTAAGALQSGLRQAGTMNSNAAAPTYSDALSWAADHVRADAAKMESCAAAGCSQPVSAVLASGPVLENLVLKTSGKAREPKAASRTVAPKDAILSAGDVGGIPIGDRVNPVKYLCQPTFESSDALGDLPKPAQAEFVAFATPDRMPTFHALQQWKRPVDAARYFEILDVRADTCPLAQRKQGTYTDIWESESGPDAAVRTLAWRGTSRPSKTGDPALYSLADAALVDDTVVMVLALSTRGPVARPVVDDLLKRTIARLGTDPDPSG